MASAQQLMAESLEQLHILQKQNPNLVLKGTEELSRIHLKRLLDNGWLQEVMKGWYIPSRPGCGGRYNCLVHIILAFHKSLSQFQIWR